MVASKDKLRAVIYARVSRSVQSSERQIQELKKVKEYEVIGVFQERISGFSKSMSERPQLQKALKFLKENRDVDVLMISEVSRLGRNTKEVLTLIEELEKEEIILYIHNLGCSIGGFGAKEQAFTKLIVTIMSDLARLESEQLSERIKSGIRERKRRGETTGRKIGSIESKEKFLKKHKDIVKFLNKGFSYREIQKQCNCGPSTIRKVKEGLDSIDQKVE